MSRSYLVRSINNLLVEASELSHERVNNSAAHFFNGAKSRAVNCRLAAVTTCHQNHNSIVRMVCQLEADGSLRLANRTQKWNATIRYWWTLSSISGLIAVALINLGCIFLWFKNYQVAYNINNAIGFIEFNLTSGLTLFILVIGGTAIIMVFLDQNYAVLKIIEEFRNCLVENGILFEQIETLNDLAWLEREQIVLNHPTVVAYEQNNRFLDTLILPDLVKKVQLTNGNQSKHKNKKSSIISELSSSSLDKQDNKSKLETKIEELNRNLLRSLINYRMFKRQFLPVRQYHCYILAIIMAVAIILPIFVVLQASYLTKNNLVLLSGPILLFGCWYDIAHLFICSYHALVRQLFQVLFNLLAQLAKYQVIDLDLQQRRKFLVSVLNPYIIAQFRREIKEP